MQERGHSEEEIENVTKLLIECGSMKKLKETLINLGEDEEKGINLKK